MFPQFVVLVTMYCYRDADILSLISVINIFSITFLNPDNQENNKIKPWFVAFADFRVIHTTTLANFKLLCPVTECEFDKRHKVLHHYVAFSTTQIHRYK